MTLAQAQGQQSSWLGMMPLVLIVVVMYFLMIRPQRKRQKEHQAMVSALKSGDEVVTSGGIYGTVAGVDEKGQTLWLKITGDIKIKIDRGAIARVENQPMTPTS
ncbi:preprotein translocase subunit YajC [bacterium]|nr:preprotein translocase subunit YajC [bacterium]MBU1637908.1 preprotein translocase subunit YajC [bacterium]RQV94226.1 MAG: preprotein translocase subunit YajC [bacterium]